MEKILRDVPLFVEVAKQKSFTKAADTLDIPLSTVSRRIITLEKELGLSLFKRSARKVELTESGKMFFERCSFIVDETESALETLSHNLKNPTGRVRISLSTSVYHHYLKGILSEFAAQHPGIQLHVHLSEAWVDLTSDPFDLDIRVGVLPDSNLRVRKLATLRPVLFASPKLLEFYPTPQVPSDLSKIPCINFFQAGNVWSINKGNKTEMVEIQVAHISNDATVTAEFVLRGLGVGWVMPNMSKTFEETGALIRLLPGWSPENIELNIVIAERQVPKRVRLFIDYLTACLSKIAE